MKGFCNDSSWPLWEDACSWDRCGLWYYMKVCMGKVYTPLLNLFFVFFFFFFSSVHNLPQNPS